MANLLQAKVRFVIATLFAFICLPFLHGCAPMLITGASVGTSEFVSGRATQNVGHVPATGEFLRKSSYLTAPPEPVDVPFMVRYAMETSWECFAGRNDYIGQRLCLQPGEVSRMKNSSQYLCKRGLSGGSVTKIAAPPEFQSTWFCKFHTSPAQAYSNK